MAHSRRLASGLLMIALAACALTEKPAGHGPQWIERPAQDEIDANGKPDRVVRLPSPSLSTVFLYLGGAEPGFAVCERDYFVRGETIVGYSEHGTDPKCNRHGGNRG
jgi:hypothetical protein